MGKNQMRVFPISGFLVSPFQTKIVIVIHNSRTSNDINIKLGPATKLNKKNTSISKKLDDDVMSANCKVIVIFLIYAQFGEIPKPDSGPMVC